MAHAGTAIIAGGSIGGLFAAAALRKAGWGVQIFERTRVELAGRGAGIVTHPVLVDAFEAVGAQTRDLGVHVSDRVAYDMACEVVKKIPYPQIVTSWDRIYQILRILIPDDVYHLGRCVVGYENEGDQVTAIFDDGSREQADLLVGADGFRSAVRGQMLPDVQPIYSGYVVWRAVADEGDLPRDVYERIFENFGFFVPNGAHIAGYPIAGVNNDLRVGHRRYNFVWYTDAKGDELRDMLTDDEGTHYPVSIPPPRIREDVLERMDAYAMRRMPPQFVEIIRGCPRPFFTPIYDHCSPSFADGRVALVGDAACVARPHVGMGVTKAAMDAVALARHVSGAPVIKALHAYSNERVAHSRRTMEQGRRLGAFIFDTDPGVNQDGRSNTALDEIMLETAVELV